MKSSKTQKTKPNPYERTKLVSRIIEINIFFHYHYSIILFIFQHFFVNFVIFRHVFDALFACMRDIFVVYLSYKKKNKSLEYILNFNKPTYRCHPTAVFCCMQTIQIKAGLFPS